MLQELIGTIHARVIKHGEALRLKASQDLVDRNEKYEHFSNIDFI